MNIGDIVISINGRDAGKRFLVITVEDSYSQIVNGKTRRLEKPKRKKHKHLKPEGKTDSLTIEKIKEKKLTNNETRKILAQYERSAPDAER